MVERKVFLGGAQQFNKPMHQQTVNLAKENVLPSRNRNMNPKERPATVELVPIRDKIAKSLQSLKIYVPVTHHINCN